MTITMNWKPLQSWSLKSRVTLFTLTIFLIAVWSLSFYASSVLRGDMQRQLGEQQFSTVSLLAAHVNDELDRRLRALESVGATISPSLLKDAAALQARMEQRPVLLALFNGGVIVLGPDGTTVADIPLTIGRIGVNYMDREYIAVALKEGKSGVGRPVRGKKLPGPLIAMAAPIKDARGNVIGALAGTTDLSKPNFLDKIADGKFGKTGGFLIADRQHRLIVTASDKSRVMEALPPPGVNPFIDRRIQGQDGYEIQVSARGVEVLTSAKSVPAANWSVAVSLPTEEAFAPIRAMRERMLLATALLTLLAGVLVWWTTWWMLRRQLSPMIAATRTLDALSGTNQPPQPIPVTSKDEIGELIGGFNRLLGAVAQREEDLRRFRVAMDATADGIYLVDRASLRFIDVNEAACRIQERSREELLALGPEDVLSVPREELERMYDAVIAGGARVEPVERRRLRKDGSPIWLELHRSAQRSAKGWMIVTVVHDITERRQTDLALRESEERYRTLIEWSPEAIAVHRGGKLLYVNSAAIKMFGATSAQDLIGKPIFDLIHPDFHQIVLARVRDASARAVATPMIEERYLKLDGTVIDVEVQGVPILYHGEAAIHASLRDITERKKATEALRASEEKFAKAFRSSPMFISISDVSDGRYIDVNEGFLRATEHTREEVIGHTSANIALWKNPQDRQDAIDLLLKHGSIRGFEAELCKKSGEPMVCEIWAEPIELGEKPCVIWITNDITERKRMEKINLQAQKMESLGTLAGGVAHDFNNIIAAIMGNAELVRQDLGPVHEALESLEEIRKASRRAKDLVQQILAFGRKQVLERKVISLEPAVKEAGRLLRSTLPAGISLKVQCDSDAPTVLADTTQIEQILINLCTNAWQAMESDKQEATVEIRLQLHEQAVSGTPDAGFAIAAGPMQPGRYACLAVQDNGSGMDRTTLTRIFEPFFTTKPVGKGTGLGLSVVHSVAQDHGASIQVRSAPGEGSVFRVYFPAAQATEEVVLAPTTGGALVHGQGKHILYIDDDEAIVFLMTRLLERQGYRVSGFTEAQTALAAVRSNPGQFDLAVTDYNMPVMSGLDVARALKAIRADLPVALASGYITDELRQEAPAAGVSELIYKPNTAEDLCEAVARLASANTVSEAAKPS